MGCCAVTVMPVTPSRTQSEALAGGSGGTQVIPLDSPGRDIMNDTLAALHL